MQNFRIIFKNAKGQPHSLTVQAASADVAWAALCAKLPALTKNAKLLKVIAING
jgi:hypothetical protein